MNHKIKFDYEGTDLYADVAIYEKKEFYGACLDGNRGTVYHGWDIKIDKVTDCHGMPINTNQFMRQAIQHATSRYLRSI